MCMGCAKWVGQSGKCPICRGPIRRLQTLFLTGVSATGGAVAAAAVSGEADTTGATKENDSSDDQDGETKEDQFDRKFIIRNNIGAFAPIGTRGVGDAIIDLIRDIPHFNFMQNGLTGNFESTLSKATDRDVQRIQQRLQERGLILEVMNDAGDTKVYEIKRAG